jgi:sterol 14-demethylase
VSHRIPEIFPNPELFDPDRYSPERNEDHQPFSWVAFGGGRHKCTGNAFAMLQLKAIFCILLRRYEFELVDAPDSYQDDFEQMVVQPKEPCRVRYRKRVITKQASASQVAASKKKQAEPCPVFQVKVDYDLCQGHATCMTEAPEIFHVNEKGNLTVLLEMPPQELMKKAKLAEKYCPTKAIKIETH